jgi:ATP:corrinoid adenosyltransferase
MNLKIIATGEERTWAHILQLNDRADLVSEIITAAHQYRCETVAHGKISHPYR